MKSVNTVLKTAILIVLVLAAVAGATQSQPSAAVAALKPLPPDSAYPGEVRAFAGQACPSNWLAADGKEYPTGAHKRLFAATGDLWGSTSPSTFKVPDLRGMFLRGWQRDRAMPDGDPEAASRTIPPGAPVDPNARGNQVGTYQADAFASHAHTTTLTARWGDKFADTIGWGADNGQHPGGPFGISSSASGGPETRPRNVYLLFCIRDAN